MLKKRFIAVLILLNGQVVQSVRFKHTNVIHYDPIHAIEALNKWSVDEIVVLNVSRDQDSRIMLCKRARENFSKMLCTYFCRWLDYRRTIRAIFVESRCR